MAEAKRYTFTFCFRFDKQVDSAFLPDLKRMNEQRLVSHGYEVDRESDLDRLIVTFNCGQLDMVPFIEHWGKVVLHFNCDYVKLDLRNINVPAAQPTADCPYRYGSWTEKFDGMEYSFLASTEERRVSVIASLKQGEDPERWRKNFIFMAQRLQQVGHVTKLYNQLLQAEAGGDVNFKTAARYKLLAAIGRIV